MNHEGMKFSSVSRELIADSIEAVVHGLAYDGLVGFGGCDKTLPGVMMGMVRCNVPSAFIYGGAALPGRFTGPVTSSIPTRGRRGDDRGDGRNGLGAARTAVPAVGRRLRRQFTANTMAMVSRCWASRWPTCRWSPASIAERAAYARGPDSWSCRRSSMAGRCRVTSSPAGRWKTPALSSPRPAARPTPRCISRRSPTRPASSSTSTMWRGLRSDPGHRRPAPRRPFHRQGVHEVGGTAVIIRALIDGAISTGLPDDDRRDPRRAYGDAPVPDGAVIHRTAR